MSLQIYALKKNFAVQKAERFFKERRVQAQFVDLKKHRLGLRELQLFARAAGGARNLVDRDNINALSHPVAHTDNEDVILEYLMEYGQGQLCFTTHNIGPMDVLKRNKKSIDFLSVNHKIYPWVKNGNYSPANLYKNGMIEGSPFNIDSTDFIGVFNTEEGEE